MLSALLRAGRYLTAGLSCLSTADSILMSSLALHRRICPRVPAHHCRGISIGSGDLFPFALSTYARVACAGLCGVWKEGTLPLQHAGASGLLQPLGESAWIRGDAAAVLRR